MDQTMPTIFHVSRSKLLGTRVARINKNFAENVLLANKCIFSMTNFRQNSEQLTILINVDYQLFVPFQCSDHDRNKRKTQKNSTKDLTDA